MPENRWRVEKHFGGYWQCWKISDGVRVPGTLKTWRSWAAAMGYVNLKIAQAAGRLP
jgi:hypothetical protein